jgi:CRISPR-associated protein Csb2
MESWTKVHGTSAPGWIAGHEADGTPARAAHLAIVPMANLGWDHSDGRLLGLALLPPKAITARWAEPGPGPFRGRQAFLRVLAGLGEVDAEGSRMLTLAPRQGKGGWEWRLRPAESGAHSLAPARYLRAATHWASATPVLLDRHLKAEGDAARAESVEIVARACERIGLPRPVAVEVGKYSAIRGAPPARPPGGAPNWQNWSRKTSFGQRWLFHVRLTFAGPVPGPVLIGAGRFVGLGLCLPVKAVS